MRKFKVGVVGMGFIGIAHLDALRRLGNVQVAAVCDAADLSAKQSRIQDAAVYKDYHEMFEKEKLDAVHICTPNKLHFPVAMEALDRGIAVVCEKPFTWSLEEAEKLSEMAEKKNIPNFINYCNRFYPIVREMRSRIKKGEMGTLIFAEGGYRQDCLLKETDFTWRMLSENSGKTRVVADLGSHWFDLVEHLSNKKITAVFAQFKTHYPVRMQKQGGYETFQKSDGNAELKPVSVDTEDIANVLFRMEDGVVGNAMFSQMCAGRKNELWMNLDGTLASFSWNLEKPEECMIGKRGEATALLRKDFETLEDENAYFAGYPAGHTEGFADAIFQGFRQFYEYFGTQDERRVYADFHAGCRSMLLAEKIYQSACEEKWISL